MTATAERVRGWGWLFRFRPATTRPAAPEPAPDLTPAGAAVEQPLPRIYESLGHETGTATVALGWGKVPEPAVEDERTRIIARFDISPDQPADTIPPLEPGADLLAPAIFDQLMHESGLPDWDSTPATDDDNDRSGELLTWNVRGVS